MAPTIKVTVDDAAKAIKVERPNDERLSRSLHGTTRNIIKNMIEGVTKGYEKRLKIEGVGYQALKDGKTVVLKVGYANDIRLTPPDGVSADLPDPTTIVVKGADKQKVGQFAAEVRGARKPEPYKGKGIRYENETVRRKEGSPSPAAGNLSRLRLCITESQAAAVGNRGTRRGEEERWTRRNSARAAMRRRNRVRRKITGTQERPRLSVFRSVEAHLRSAHRRFVGRDHCRGRQFEGRRTAATSRRPSWSARRSPKPRRPRASLRRVRSRALPFHGRVALAVAATEAGLVCCNLKNIKQPARRQARSRSQAGEGQGRPERQKEKGGEKPAK